MSVLWYYIQYMEKVNDASMDRALFLLYRKFNTPGDMYHFWRLTGSYKVTCPPIERYHTLWYKELPLDTLH